jgi:hypothetical protein
VFADFLGTFMELAGGSVLVIAGTITLAWFVDKADKLYREDKRKK